MSDKCFAACLFFYMCACTVRYVLAMSKVRLFPVSLQTVQTPP